VNALAAMAALLAMLAVGGLGFIVGARRARSVVQADVAMWRSLADELHLENGKLRCQTTSAPSSSELPSGPPNALRVLRTRLGFGRGEVAQALGIPILDVETLEHTRLGLLELEVVESFVGALGCRLDVVAQHVDGDAIWLRDEGGQS